MNMLSIYSGIGGTDLAAHWAGLRTVAMCDADEKCRVRLRRHWPGVPIFENDEDVTAGSFLAATGIERPDIIVGTPPCQPHSVAGLQRHQDDPRDRWPQMRRIVDEFRPAVILVENVGGFSDLAQSVVAPDLDALSYSVAILEIPIAALGAPHPRMRVFVLAYADRLRQQQPEGIIPNLWRRPSNGRQGSSTTDADRSLRVESISKSGRCDSSITGDDRARTADADNTGRRERRRTESMEPEQRSVERGSSAPVDDANERGRGELRGSQELDAAECAGEGSAMVNATSSGSQEGKRGAKTTLGRSARRNQRDVRDSTRPTESRLRRGADGLPLWLESFRWPVPLALESMDDGRRFYFEQFGWEPRRTTTDRDERRERIKQLGNAVSPVHVYPIFAAIVAAMEAA